ncbi:hypothetical protein ACQZQZ_20010 [Aeromonas salmonicida subsp. pectinolytica]
MTPEPSSRNKGYGDIRMNSPPNWQLRSGGNTRLPDKAAWQAASRQGEDKPGTREN